MNNSQRVNSKIQIQENKIEYSFVIKGIAHLVSFIFHPLFIPFYCTIFLLYLHPSYFIGNDPSYKKWLVIRIVYGTVFMPLITVLLLKQLKFIDTVFLRTQKDRIIPYIACGIYFFWLYLVCRNDNHLPGILTAYMLGIFIASSAALIANIYYKISMHAIGMGGFLGLFLLIMQQNTMLMTWPLSLCFLITGLVCTSRMIVSDHQPREIYAGIVVGLISQMIGTFVQL
jgi:hypothetical protein